MELKNKHERDFANAIKTGYRVSSRLEEIIKCFPKINKKRAYEIYNALTGENRG